MGGLLQPKQTYIGGANPPQPLNPSSPPPSPHSNEGSTKEPMSDGGKRNVNFVMTEEVLQCQDQAAWGLLQPKQTN